MIIGQKSEISFKVNVMGTSVEPTARVIIETHPQISFPATKIGEAWVSTVDVPGIVVPGSYKLRVDVLLNNRVFSPFSKMIELTGAPVAEEAVPVEEAAVEEPKQETTSVVSLPVEEPKLTVIEEVQPVAEVPKVKRIIVAEEKPRKITIAADMFKFTPKVVERVELPVLAAPTLKRLEKVVETKPAPSKKDKTVLEIKHDLPITLTKGEIVYE